MSEQSTTARRRPGPRAWLGLGAALAAVLVLLVLIAVACGARSDDPDRAGVGSASTAGGASPVAADPDGDDGGSDDGGSGTGDDDSGGQDDGGQGDGEPGDGDASATPAPAGPEIEYFRVAQEPQCPGGTDNFPTEGQPVVLEWRVTGTEQVTLSIDGPGVYNTYPAEGSDTINFPCAGAEGDTQQHTYLLTAQNADGTSTETLVVEATVHERSDT